MLKIINLNVEAEGKHILQNINLSFEEGKNYCILGKNGSGKSSLATTIMGNPKYKVTSGKLRVTRKKNLDTHHSSRDTAVDITALPANERAQLGIFLAFQHIPEIRGVKVFEFMKSIYDTKTDTKTSFLEFKKIIEPLLKELDIDKEFLRRDLNVGFSGGERRKIEILQIKLLQPTYIFLDEVDSGLDVDALNTIAKHIKTINHRKNSFIIITHLFKIVDHLPIDTVYVMDDGKIIRTGDHKLIAKISKEGFKKL